MNLPRPAASCFRAQESLRRIFLPLESMTLILFRAPWGIGAIVD